MFRRVTAVVPSLAVLVLAGCNTYVGRFVRLRGVDVEDYRQLPSRTVAAAPTTRPLVEARDSAWMLRRQFAAIPTSDSLDRLLAANGTTAFLIMHDGRLVDERYYNGAGRDSLFKVFSITKSVLSALIGVAEADGLLTVQDSLGQHLDLRANAPLARLRLTHVLDNVSGLRYRRGFAPWKEQPRMYYTTDARGYLASAQSVRSPGERFEAEDLSPLLAAWVLDSAVRARRAAPSLSVYASMRLWQPMGAEHDALWTIDHAGDGLEKAESGLTARARDLVRFAQLYLDGGMVGDRRVLPEAWVRTSVTAPAAGTPTRFREGGFYKQLWWGHQHAGREHHDFYANGHFGQRVFVCPEKRLIIVRLGASSGAVDWTQFVAGIASGW